MKKISNSLKNKKKYTSANCVFHAVYTFAGLSHQQNLKLFYI